MTKRTLSCLITLAVLSIFHINGANCQQKSSTTKQNTKQFDVSKATYQSHRLSACPNSVTKNGKSARNDPKLRAWIEYTNLTIVANNMHWTMLSPAEMRAQSYGITGLDAEAILPRDDYSCVKTVYPGTPAALAGIVPGDKLLKVNGNELPRTAGSHVNLWKLLTGPAGSSLVLAVQRGDQVVRLSIKRMNIEDIQDAGSRKHFEYLFAANNPANMSMPPAPNQIFYFGLHGDIFIGRRRNSLDYFK